MGGNVTEMTNSTSGQPAPFLPWDNPHNVIDFATFQDIEFVLNCVLDPALWMLGVGTNTINLAVFYRQGLKDRMNLCLFRLVSGGECSGNGGGSSGGCGARVCVCARAVSVVAL